MKRLLLGSLLGLVISFNAASPAGAAEIPPVEIPATEACQAKFKTVFANFYEEINEGVTDPEERRAERKYLEELEAAGCVSDIEPLLKPMKTKPGTSECASAAAAAQAFWAPLTKRMNVVTRNFQRKVYRPYKKRLNRIVRERRRLEEAGASKQRIDRLRRKESRLSRKFYPREQGYEQRIEKIAAPDAHATMLTLYELISLRCVGQLTFDFDSTPKNPASRAYKRNESLIWTSAIYVADQAMNGSDSGSTAAFPSSLG